MIDVLTFNKVVERIVSKDLRYKEGAYFFLRNCLEITVLNLRKDEIEEYRHVNAKELLTGIVDHAIDKYGSMSLSVLEFWGINTTEDIGNIVFNLIDYGAIAKSSNDSISDFIEVFDLNKRLMEPFAPKCKFLSNNKVTSYKKFL